MRTIQRVLVASRGEPAAAIGRRLEAAGFEAVALYADVDGGDAWLEDVAYATRIATEPGVDPYRDGWKLVSAALDSGCDGIHPGVGGAAADPVLAHMVMNVGLAWIGSPPQALEACLDRGALRARARELGLPVVASSPPLDDAASAESWAARMGGPVRIAPARRGSGRRAIEAAAHDVASASAALRGLPVVVERRVAPARHLVVGVAGDGNGEAITLGEHERSLALHGRVRARESPPPGIPVETLERARDAARGFAAAIGHRGVGALEILVGADGRWWFHDFVPSLFPGFLLHDEVYGLDLVGAQARLAAGETLGWEQAEISSSGVATELLLCAVTDGVLGELDLPDGASTAIAAGAEVRPQHDPELARLVVSGPMRHALLVRARAALADCRVAGVVTDTALLSSLLADPRMWEGRIDTGLLEEVARAALSGAGAPA